MNKKKVLLTAGILLCVAVVTQAQDGEDIWEQETLTNGFWGLNDSLAASGIEVGFGLTNIYQLNLNGGTSTHNHQGRHTGSYDLEIGADLQQLLGIEGGTLFVHTKVTVHGVNMPILRCYDRFDWLFRQKILKIASLGSQNRS